MFQMSDIQQQQMDIKLLVAASCYAKELMDFLNNSTKKEYLPLDQEGQSFKAYYYEAFAFIQSRIIELAEEVTDIEGLQGYLSYSEDLHTFENYVDQSLPEDMFIQISDGDVWIAKQEEALAVC